MESRYCFVFHYPRGCFCVGADSLVLARQLFQEHIDSGPRSSFDEEKTRRFEEKHKRLLELDILLVEPEIL